MLARPYKINGPITFRTGVALFDLSLDSQHLFSKFSVPFLTMHGTKDGYTDIEGSRSFFFFLFLFSFPGCGVCC